MVWSGLSLQPLFFVIAFRIMDGSFTSSWRICMTTPFGPASILATCAKRHNLLIFITFRRWSTSCGMGPKRSINSAASALAGLCIQADRLFPPFGFEKGCLWWSCQRASLVVWRWTVWSCKVFIQLTEWSAGCTVCVSLCSYQEASSTQVPPHSDGLVALGNWMSVRDNRLGRNC